MFALLQHRLLIARRIAASGLLAAMFQVCCVFCAAACGHETIETADAETSCTLHTCCASKDDAGARAAGAVEHGSCCLAAHSAATLPEKQRTPDMSAVISVPTDVPSASHVPVGTSLWNLGLHVPDRGGTYLRWCVFLI